MTMWTLEDYLKYELRYTDEEIEELQEELHK